MILPKWPACPLTEFGPGRLVRVASIEGGTRMSRRLYEMGVRPGAIGEILTGGGRNVILEVDGVRLALGRGMAKRILVETLDGAA